MNFFRVQHKGHSFESMKLHRTYIGFDEEGEEITELGLSATLSPDGGAYDWGGAMGAMEDDDEVIVFKGEIIRKLYDGYVAYPISEVARFTVAEWNEKLADESAWDYEDWE